MDISENSYSFQLSEHLKQSRPGVKNPVVRLSAFEDNKICVVTKLKEYLKRTVVLRGTESQLFISYTKPFKKVSRGTLSRWVKDVMGKAGIDTSKFKPHSTRAASTSAASRASVKLEEILETAGWSSESTFAKYYNKPIAKKNQFANKLLGALDKV
jgi:site-specific recombinase XerD